jgi:sugar lactone lactonase YvrE
MKIGGFVLATLMAFAPAAHSGHAPQTTSAAPALVVSFDPALGQLPESIAEDPAGNLYVSIANTVVKVDTASAVSTFATLPISAAAFATGVKLGPDGFLYVASAAFDPTLAASFVWRLSLDTAAVEQVAALDPAGFPNDLAFDDDGNIYVTDPFLGQVWKIDGSGEATVWLSDPAFDGNPSAPALGAPFGVDGIAFDRNKRHLYFGNLDFGTILRVRLASDGSPGDLELFAEDARLVGADGIAFDRAGTLFVAVNAQDRIAKVDRRGRVSVVAEGGLLDGPSGFVFGVRPCERHTLFISNFAISRALGLQPGVPRPGILSLEVAVPGLPVP